MTPKELEHVLRDLLGKPLADTELRARLEQLAAAEVSFSGFTWLYGPELYRRNRICFRPFILSRFSTIMALPKWRVEEIKWAGERGRLLDAWLEGVDRNDDFELFRRLYEWKLSARFDWRSRDKRDAEITRELLVRFQSAGSPAQRQGVLRKFNLWFGLDEAAACELYRTDAAASAPFILQRLKTNWFSGEPKRRLMTRLLQLADDRRDEDFRWKLYRRQVPEADWIKDCLALCDRIHDSVELGRELELRHPEGWGMNLADGFFKLVERRERDVFPYVMRHLRQVWRGWLMRGKYGKLADYARTKGWWDLWAALVRTCGEAKEFNQEILRLVEDTRLDPDEVEYRLLMLAGVSREFNWGGFGLAMVHQLEEPVALAFYRRLPELLRGPFKVHVAAHQWGEMYPKLLAQFLLQEDEEMIDYMASRLVTRWGKWSNAEKMVDEAGKLADYYAALKADEAVFCRRAAAVLGQVPAYSITNYHELIRQNRLARLLFERSASLYLADPRSLADLVEAAEIHVMALAYRALGLNDDRARQLAGGHLPLLLGTLLRPMERGTRSLAFGALANAAADPAAARLILERARDAMALPDTKYPKEQLLGLMARLLHRWPELRGTGEQPVIYERAA